MNEIQQRAIHCSEKIFYKFRQSGKQVEESSCSLLKDKYPDLNWTTGIFTSNNYRRAHIDIIDATESHKLWIMHTVILPHLNDPSPIFGFDIICGPTRISGGFHDFSFGGADDHFMMSWFDDRVTGLNWKKERTLPEWAQKIFSHAMVAVGAITDLKEADQFLNIGLENLSYYLSKVGKTADVEFSQFYEVIEAQKQYCINQRKNPHTPRTMTMLGMSEEDAKFFLDEVLFPLN